MIDLDELERLIMVADEPHRMDWVDRARRSRGAMVCRDCGITGAQVSDQKRAAASALHDASIDLIAEARRWRKRRAARGAQNRRYRQNRKKASE